MEEDIERFMDEEEEEEDTMDEDENEDICSHTDEDNMDNENTSEELAFYPNVPVVMPRARFAGACNVETVKDGQYRSVTVKRLLILLPLVNFLGPDDEFIVSGSDDGHFFMWKKSTRQLHDIFEGDGSVVNVIEAHPHLPVVAVSGIDTTVKVSSSITM
jgi:WD40 repeat protein